MPAASRAPTLHPDLVSRVLQAFGLSRHPAPDLAGLGSLYDAWCRHVPFDNIRKLIAVSTGAPGPLPGDDPAEFFENWLAHGVGGTCWAGNGALCALLEALGFSAHRGVATMMVAPGIPPNHGTVVVDLPEGRHVVDASIMTVRPLPVRIAEASQVEHPAWGVVGEWLDDDFAIRWRPLHRGDTIHCRIDEWQVDTERFRLQHEATRAWSPFNFELTFNLTRGDTRIGVAAGECATIDGDGLLSSVPITDRIAFLVGELGVSEAMASRLPEDRATPPPPGSRSAQALSTE
jgi:N-hydroxyarylamine O-acetyltransferase